MKQLFKGCGFLFLSILALALLLLAFSIALMVGGFLLILVGIFALISPAIFHKIRETYTPKIPASLLEPVTGRVIGSVVIILGIISMFSGQALFAELTEDPPKEQVATTNEKKTNAPAKSTSAESQEKKTERLTAKVKSVIDGDTLVVDLNGKEEKVRMILVDTPETVHPNKPAQPFGKEASEFTKGLLTGQTIELEKDAQERDKYGRLLAYVYLNGKSVQEQLLEKGLARVASFPPNVKYIDEYRAIQEKAQQAKIGIWSIENYAREDGFYPPAPKVASTPKSTNSSSSSSSTTSKPKSSSKPPTSYRDMDCDDFSTQREAQAYFKSRGGSRTNNVDGLDRDHDGIACETLP